MANDPRDADRAWELMKKIGLAAAITGTHPAIGTNRKVAIQMPGIDPIEDPPIKPGQPAEPPQESPPGNPRPEIPTPVREPDAPAQPDELPGYVPEELPTGPDVNPGQPQNPTATMQSCYT